MKDRYINTVFFALVASFILLVSFFFVPSNRELFLFAAVLASIFFLLGGLLVYLTLKSKLPKKERLFLILTGAPALGFIVCVVLHNLFYGLSTLTNNILKDVLEILHAGFFLIAIIGCPLLFLVGVIGRIISGRKN